MSSAVRKTYYEDQNVRINHFEKTIRKTNAQSPSNRQNLNRNKKAEITEIVEMKVDSFFKTMLYITISVMLFAFIIFGGYRFVGRYADINMNQREISILKKSVQDIDKKIDLLIMQRENSISMAELERYAIDELEMIKPDLGNKLIVDEVVESRLKADISFGKNTIYADKKQDIKYRGGL